ncbi:MAG: SdpI family protein [Clostridia bacterium]|nr:SdpI family protein [Clostridia bacterium]
MIKKNKWNVIIASLVILLPIAAGLVMWDYLPDTMTTHWGAGGNADGFSSKAFAVFVPSCILFALYWLCIFVTSKDPKNEGQSRKALGLVMWIMPLISIFVNAIMYLAAFGKLFNMQTLMFLMLGLMFLVLGNYLPKCKQNYTIGIKLPWTLASEDNWNKTHRLGGKLWVVCGLLMILCAFLPQAAAPYCIVAVIIVATLIPTLYSYALYKKEIGSGKTSEALSAAEKKYFSLGAKICLPIIAVLLAVLAVIMFTGDINVSFGDTTLTIEASYYNDLTVEYAEIDSVEYRDGCDAGSKTFGFNSARLLLGTFENDEFGTYTRYSYTKSDAGVIVTAGDKILVIGARDAAETKAIYDELLARTEE